MATSVSTSAQSSEANSAVVGARIHNAVNPASNIATKIAWGVAAILFAWLLLFPLVGGLVVANDDLKFLRGELNVGSLTQNIQWS